jgi:hypothetical protein
VKKEKEKTGNVALPKHLLDFIITDQEWKKSRVYDESMSKIQNAVRDLNIKRGPFLAYQIIINKHKIILQEKYTLLFVSLLLFLIGALSRSHHQKRRLRTSLGAFHSHLFDLSLHWSF